MTVDSYERWSVMNMVRYEQVCHERGLSRMCTVLNVVCYERVC